jgi:hypothetical protein
MTTQPADDGLDEVSEEDVERLEAAVADLRAAVLRLVTDSDTGEQPELPPDTPALAERGVRLAERIVNDIATDVRAALPAGRAGKSRYQQLFAELREELPYDKARLLHELDWAIGDEISRGWREHYADAARHAFHAVVVDEGGNEVGVIRPPAPGACGCQWPDAPNHEALARVEARGVPGVLALFEDVDSWDACGDNDLTAVHPSDWPTFATEHNWEDPIAVSRLFGLLAYDFRVREQAKRLRNLVGVAAAAANNVTEAFETYRTSPWGT